MGDVDQPARRGPGGAEGGIDLVEPDPAEIGMGIGGIAGGGRDNAVADVSHDPVRDDRTDPIGGEVVQPGPLPDEGDIELVLGEAVEEGAAQFPLGELQRRPPVAVKGHHHELRAPRRPVKVLDVGPGVHEGPVVPSMAGDPRLQHVRGDRLQEAQVAPCRGVAGLARQYRGDSDHGRLAARAEIAEGGGARRVDAVGRAAFGRFPRPPVSEPCADPLFEPGRIDLADRDQDGPRRQVITCIERAQRLGAHRRDLVLVPGQRDGGERRAGQEESDLVALDQVAGRFAGDLGADMLDRLGRDIGLARHVAEQEQGAVDPRMVGLAEIDPEDRVGVAGMRVEIGAERKPLAPRQPSPRAFGHPPRAFEQNMFEIMRLAGPGPRRPDFDLHA